MMPLAVLRETGADAEKRGVNLTCFLRTVFRCADFCGRNFERTRKMKNRFSLSKVTAVFLPVLLAFVIVMSATGCAGDNGANSEQKTVSITVEVINGDGSSSEAKIETDEKYLRGAMEQENMIAGDEGDYGLYVTTVNGVTADTDKQEWWCITKDGEHIMEGVDSIEISDGDHYEFELKTGW